MNKIAALLFLLAWIGFQHIASAHTGEPKKVKCPIDGKEFTINVTMSYTTFGTMKDFQKRGAIGDLYESMINSCPKCHYSGYKSDFDTTFNKTTKAGILHILVPYKDNLMNDVLEAEVAAKIHLFLKDKNDEIANIFLLGSYYIKFDSTQKNKRQFFQRECINYLQKAIDNKEYENIETYPTIYYLIGELYRRTDNFENAVKYLDLSLNSPDKKDWITEIATKQREMAVMKDNKNDI